MMLKIVRFAAALTVICSQHAVAETGVIKDAILLGQSVALTGAAAQLGIQMRNGMKAYFDYVNEHGGVHGRKIELITLDDGYEPTRTVPNTKKLIEERKVFALIGYVGTPTSVPAVPVFTEAKVPFIGPFTGAESLRVPFNRYIFHIRASYFDETEKIGMARTKASYSFRTMRTEIRLRAMSPSLPSAPLAEKC
jgi:branched-chain amino acid transport system substrate-binding protein